jgi:hypothetical protein
MPFAQQLLCDLADAIRGYPFKIGMSQPVAFLACEITRIVSLAALPEETTPQATGAPARFTQIRAQQGSP